MINTILLHGAYPRKYVPFLSRDSLYSQRVPLREEFDIAVDIELWIARERHTRVPNIPPYILKNEALLTYLAFEMARGVTPLRNKVGLVQRPLSPVLALA
ncbi:unnamed protein product [Penicillium viridicatum]